jgi:LysR family tcuABC transcriptional regulator
VELRQLRYFVRVVELGSMGRAALDLGVVTSALSQQISRLEGELSTRLLQRSAGGVRPTDAGLAFLRQAQLALRHADAAVASAQQARLAGQVSVGLAPTTAAVLGMPFMQAMRERYPDVRLHLVESLSGHLAAMLGARQLDLALLFQEGEGRTETRGGMQRWSMQPLLEEHLFVIAVRGLPGLPATGARIGARRSTARQPVDEAPQAVDEAPRLRLAQLAELPLVLPSGPHGLRALLNTAFARARIRPRVIAEIDGLALLMDAVRAGVGATVQPAAALARQGGDDLVALRVADTHVRRPNLIASLNDDELSPAALAARVVLGDVARRLAREGRWRGVRLRAARI